MPGHWLKLIAAGHNPRPTSGTPQGVILGPPDVLAPAQLWLRVALWTSGLALALSP